MARYTYAIRGDPAEINEELRFREQICELKAGQQLTEHFLCDINPKGEVPVLAPASSDGHTLDPIPDSVDITWFIAGRFPGLFPKEREMEIRRLVSILHENINFFSLTFGGKQEMPQRNIALLESKLDQILNGGMNRIEPSREAADWPLKSGLPLSPQHCHPASRNLADETRIRSRKLDALEPRNVQKAVDNATDYLAEIAQLLEASTTGWIKNTA